MNRNRPQRTALLTSILALLSLPVACSPGDGGAARADLPGASAVVSQPQAPAGRFVGNVVETMDAGSYTYVCLEKDGERVWAAGPKGEVALGDELAIALDLPMENFESATLNRTFEKIYFVGPLGVDPSVAAREPVGDPHAGLPERPGATMGVTEIDVDAIEKPDGGYRVAELWERRAELVGQEVAVRGRVVKFNGGIMDRNWLHVQDGSGNREAGDHDLTVTSAGAAREGELVTVRGTVVIDQDFGSGYSYELLLEEATVTNLEDAPAGS